MKICIECGLKKPEDGFAWKVTGVYRQSLCRVCHSAYRKAHYEKNKPKYLAKARRWNVRRTNELRELIKNYLENHPCVDCGESDIIVLDFDHVSGKKYKGISKLIIDSCSLETMRREISKCEVRCANCHRRRTAKDRNIWRFRSVM